MTRSPLPLVTAEEVDQARDLVADANEKFLAFREAFVDAKRALHDTAPGFWTRLDAYVNDDLSWIGGESLESWLAGMERALDPAPEEVPW